MRRERLGPYEKSDSASALSRLVAQLQQDGVPAVEVQQTMAGLTSASKKLEELVLSGRLRHDGHPILRWCVSNACIDMDGNANIKPSKSRSRERIDGVSALVTALARLGVAPPPAYCGITVL